MASRLHGKVSLVSYCISINTCFLSVLPATLNLQVNVQDLDCYMKLLDCPHVDLNMQESYCSPPPKATNGLLGNLIQ